MENEIVEEVTEWDSESFAGGYTGLHELADREFTGAVTEGFAWLFLLNGRVVGAVDGSIESFADSEGTAYEAPHPSVPLLFAMQHQDKESKAKYYTEETPLSEVNQTLSSGNFTGYVELSENVLSGDYYIVYHGGRSLACAFIGNSRSLLTGEEAFERADDEVGIYEVYDVDIDVIPIPDDGTGMAAGSDDTVDETTGQTQADAGADETPSEAGDASGTDKQAPDSSEDTDGDAPEQYAETAQDHVDPDTAQASADDAQPIRDEPGDEGETTADDEPAVDEPAVDEPAVDEPVVDDVETQPPRAAGPDAAANEGTATPVEEANVESVDPANASGDEKPAKANATSPDGPSEDVASKTGRNPGGVGAQSTAAGEVARSAGEVASSASETSGEVTDQGEDPFSEEAQWRETHSIPSLDPSKSDPPSEQDSTPEQQTETEPENRSNAGTRSRAGATRPSGASEPEVAKLREKLRELEDARAEAEAARERLAAEREELAAERDQYREKAQQLESEVEQLEAELEQLESDLADARGTSPTARTMSSAEALAGTNLFVRYETKGEATLEKAHAGDVERDDVVDNLRLEHHTSFDTEELQVAGDPFEQFLRDTVEYRFVRWVVEDLLYEIRETGHKSGLKELFDAIPEIDRAEIDGTVSVEYTQNGDQHREQEQFDVVLRNRMGNPLIVANLNAARDPATGKMMTSLVETARRVKETSDTLGSAFLVTTSYFQPEALETADEATGGGLLNRSKRKSFVKLSRKRGFHLCLVETHDENFHMNVPEL